MLKAVLRTQRTRSFPAEHELELENKNYRTRTQKYVIEFELLN